MTQQTSAFDELVAFIRERVSQNSKKQADAKAGVYNEKSV
jgi:hypothetical protein